jgi:hypothetical protein
VTETADATGDCAQSTSAKRHSGLARMNLH